MNVYVNEKQVRIFVGAKVIDALRRVFTRRHIDLKMIDEKYVKVYDEYGNEVAFDGPLREGKHLFYEMVPF